MKRVAILQSNYIPWKGYFDLIAAVDEFILYDDMQYTRRDWRNRNQIKTPQGLQWLTVPVQTKGKYLQKIRDTKIDGVEWAAEHWRTIELNYKKARYFEEIAQWVRPLYNPTSEMSLSALNRTFIEKVCLYLGIKTKLSWSWEYALIEGKTERLADLCSQAGANEYLSGPAAKNYVEEKVFFERQIKLTWFDYSNYPEYTQLWGGFCHNVTILDLLFNCGAEAPGFMRFIKR